MIPLEIMTGGISVLVGGVLKLWAMNMKAKAAQNTQLMSAARLQGDLFQEVRNIKDVGFTWTRRIIAITMVLSVFVLPKIAALYGIDVTVGYSEWSPGFLFFEGSNTVVWHEVKGLAMTPLDTHAMMMVIGLYFGSSVAGHK